MGPPPATPGSEKSMSFQKSILGPRPKHIIVNKVKIPVASDNEVKQFYKPLSKPRVGFSKLNFRSKTPPPRRVNNNYSRPKTPQPKRHVGRQNQPHGFPDDMINQDIKDSNAYKTYYDFATGKVPPMKARKYKKVASPQENCLLSKKQNLSRRKKAPAKGDRSKGIEILSDVALSEATQLKEATKRSKKDFHISQASGSGDGTDLESRVPDEQQRKTSGTDEGTGTKLGVPDVSTYESESENESWGDSKDDNDDDSDDNSKGDDDKADSDDDDGNFDADDNERTDSDDDDKNPSFTLKDYDEEEHDEEYESDDDYENMFEEEDDDDLYKDVNAKSLGTENEKERQGDEEMTDVDQNKTDDSKQSSSVSSDFACKFLILENVPPSIDEVTSMMHVKSRQEESSTQAPSLFTIPVTAIPETATAHASTVSPTISMITPPPQLTTPSPAPSTVPTTTSIPALLDFSSLFRFD
ncbi:hypothetical protein Tco_0926098 [Tanacetum coccineum]|uniref:Uncharacterized protein n=1 Tax=Tanacetum coccineum TaxID=301880 RepID=A0ABQ5DFV2_9ASTR